MPDLSNAEISVEGEHGECLVCGESFHWEQLTNLAAGSYCDADVPEPYTVQVTKIAGGHYRLSCRGWRFSMLSLVADVKKAAEHHEASHDSGDDEADMGHDTALERDTFGDAL